MHLDLYVVATDTAVNLPNILYENQGDGTFLAIPNAGGAAGTNLGIGSKVTTVDYDQDGFLDLFVTNKSKLVDNPPFELFHNLGNENHWLEIDLEGVTSNRDGIGAQVFATAGGITQLREQTGGIHNGTQNHQRIHYGLADNMEVEKLIVRWPSGIEQKLHNIPADQIIRIVEPDDDDDDNLLEFPNPNNPSLTTPYGEPEYDLSKDKGLFLWKDEQELWHLRVTAGGALRTCYVGSIISDIPAVSVQGRQIEWGDDIVDTSDPSRIDFNLGVSSGWEDGIDFSFPTNAYLSLSLEEPMEEAASLVHIGSEQWSVNDLPLDMSGW